MEDVGSSDSYRLSMELCRYGLISGPSSGFTLQGLYQVLGRHKEEGTLDTLRQGSKPIEAVFLCCDLPFQYLDEYFDKLGPESFPPILNEVSRATCLASCTRAIEADSSLFNNPDLFCPRSTSLTSTNSRTKKNGSSHPPPPLLSWPAHLGEPRTA